MTYLSHKGIECLTIVDDNGFSAVTNGMVSVSGTVTSVPSGTQPISAASLPLPAGAALESGNLATLTAVVGANQLNNPTANQTNVVDIPTFILISQLLEYNRQQLTVLSRIELILSDMNNGKGADVKEVSDGGI